SLGPGHDETTAEAAAALAAGVAREAERTARLLEIGAWRHVLIEGDTGRSVATPIPDGVLILSRANTTPAGRLLATATRARDVAREGLRGASCIRRPGPIGWRRSPRWRECAGPW